MSTDPGNTNGSSRETTPSLVYSSQDNSDGNNADSGDSQHSEADNSDTNHGNVSGSVNTDSVLDSSEESVAGFTDVEPESSPEPLAIESDVLQRVSNPNPHTNIGIDSRSLTDPRAFDTFVPPSNASADIISKVEGYNRNVADTLSEITDLSGSYQNPGSSSKLKTSLEYEILEKARALHAERISLNNTLIGDNLSSTQNASLNPDDNNPLTDSDCNLKRDRSSSPDVYPESSKKTKN